MKKLLFLVFLFPGLVLSSELATYSVRFAVEGLALEGQPPGVGDRTLTFKMQFPAGSSEAADILWYEHLQLIFGDEGQQKARAIGDQFRQLGGRR